ncbi:MAG: hypothetical protein GEU93_09710 [Propionibacteriales bacterium]|nr:hypothetical protein [Propionibacteriales bacterium]
MERAAEIDLTDPIITGMVELDDGRLPEADGEIVVSPGLAERGHGIGSTIRLGDGAREATVAGVASRPNYYGDSDFVVAPPGGS